MSNPTESQGEAVQRPVLRLSGDRNQCPSCNEYFNRTSVFEKHRTGRFGIDRRCLTTVEMERAGMFKAADGFWRGARMPEGWQYGKRNSEAAIQNASEALGQMNKETP